MLIHDRQRSLCIRPRLVDIANEWVGLPHATIEARASAQGNDSDYGIAHDDTKSFRQRVTLECLDTLGTLRSHRAPQLDEFWFIPASSERRMLAQANAILVLGPPALQYVEQCALDADVPDPDRVFAALFVLGSTAGKYYVNRCMPIYEAVLQRTREEAAAAIEALCLCPSPVLSEVLTPFLDHTNPTIRAATVRILGYRLELSTQQWCKATSDDDQYVVLAALSSALHHMDHHRCDLALEQLYISANEDVVHAALRAGLALGLTKAQEAARVFATQTPIWARALDLVALLGSNNDRYLFDRALFFDLTAAARACGCAGWLPLGSKLLMAYESQSKTGNGSDSTGEHVKRALNSMVPLPPDTPLDAGSLAQAWFDSTRQLDINYRYRDGFVCNLARLMHQLNEDGQSRLQRQELYFELQVLTEGRVPRFSAFDFIGVQVDALDRIAAVLRSEPVLASPLN
jgi:hypothetical protein